MIQEATHDAVSPAHASAPDHEDCQPYLSIVVASRNDDHGGNARERTQASFSTLLEQLEQWRIPAEFLLIDWNPPPTAAPLATAIQWPTAGRWCSIGAITVPAAVHRRFRYHDRFAMHRNVAVNAGIRRARGRFVLPGVIDLFYADELLQLVAARALRSGKMYRARRYAVAAEVMQCATAAQRLAFCRRHGQPPPPVAESMAWLPADVPRLYTQACGDFQLLAAADWTRLRGYREADIVGSHSDSLLAYAAHALGVEEELLPASHSVYHIEHAGGFGETVTSPTWPRRLAEQGRMPWRVANMLRHFGMPHFRSRRFGVPTLTGEAFLALVRELVADRRSPVFNDADWGLGRDRVPIHWIRRAAWDAGSDRCREPHRENVRP